MPAAPVTTAAKVERFRELHVRGRPLLLANAWDAGSARLLSSLGFEAIATTSGGIAATLGRRDGLTREVSLARAVDVVAATDLPVSADFENGYADDPDGVARTVHDAAAVGLAGCSIEDFTGDQRQPLYELSLAAERIAAAAEAARTTAAGLVLTARAENYLRDRPDIDDTIARLAAYAEAGADVVYAPYCNDPDDIRRIVAAVDRPVNVLAHPDAPSVPQLAELGVARVSVGSAFTFAGLGAVVDAARELLGHGTYGYWDNLRKASAVASEAFDGW